MQVGVRTPQGVADEEQPLDIHPLNAGGGPRDPERGEEEGPFPTWFFPRCDHLLLRAVQAPEGGTGAEEDGQVQVGIRSDFRRTGRTGQSPRAAGESAEGRLSGLTKRARGLRRPLEEGHHSEEDHDYDAESREAKNGKYGQGEEPLAPLSYAHA